MTRFTHRIAAASATILALAETSCALRPGEASLDPSVVVELRHIADVLAHPQDFRAGHPLVGGRASVSHPIDFGCATPESFLPDVHWTQCGLPTGTSDVRAWDPSDSSREPGDRVARACWRLEQLGCVGLLRDRLKSIAGDASLGDAMRCQAVHALGADPQRGSAAALAHLVGDEVVGAECVRALLRIGPVRLDGLRAEGLPHGEPARSRVAWLLARHVDVLTVRELRWLAHGLEGPSSSASLWTLWRAHDVRASEVVDAVLPQLRRDDPPQATLALAANARVRDPRLTDVVLGHATQRSGASRELALQHLGHIECPRAFDLLLRLSRDDAATTGDRAAAVLGLSSYRAGRAEWIEAALQLLASPEPRLRRAALQALTASTELSFDVLAAVESLLRDDDDDVRLLARLVVDSRR